MSIKKAKVQDSKEISKFPDRHGRARLWAWSCTTPRSTKSTIQPIMVNKSLRYEEALHFKLNFKKEI
ncbi:hypothetical protein HanIR_Chr07g0314711 [Helianthus annuus]|nr:hypothetical protein HanIR_Chr07g0314711 [Helianthus annuus]